MAPNQVEEDVTIEPSDKTAVTDNTVDNTKQKSEPEPDYKVKFSESSKEALRLRDELKKKEELEAQWQEVADVINTESKKYFILNLFACITVSNKSTNIMP